MLIVYAIKRHVFEINKATSETDVAGVKSLILLKEAGIYQLIFKSKLPSAVQFQQWVFEEVLPSIRKTGSYSVGQDRDARFKEQLMELFFEGLTDLEICQKLMLAQMAGIFDDKLCNRIFDIYFPPDEKPFDEKVFLDYARHLQKCKEYIWFLIKYFDFCCNVVDGKIESESTRRELLANSR